MRPIVALLAIAGCTHHHPIAEVGQHATHGVAVELRDGTPVHASVQLGPQGVLLRTDDGRILDAGAVATVTHVDHARGALEGLGIGLVIGAGTGAVIGFASGDDPPDQFISFSAEDKAVLSGILLGGTGALLGLVVGAATGSRDEYRVEAPAVTLVGPRGSVAGFTLAF